MQVVHILADALDCPHKGYSLALRIAGGKTSTDLDLLSHKWSGRLRGAKMPDKEREAWLVLYPNLNAVWNHPLWNALRDKPLPECQQCFDLRVSADHRMRRFSGQTMLDWIGVPDPDRIYDIVLLLRSDDKSLFLQRLWLLKNLAAYLLVATIFEPFRAVVVPLYRCIRSVPLSKAFSKRLHECLPFSPICWERWVNAAQTAAEDWQRSGEGRTQSMARQWLWEELASSDFQRRLASMR
ncbi:hypothetical protein [Pseudomonas asiatica]|uniref:hypothetical protein n=1 Tax=Pseudomonas asiatica TaxID=2219225 RepID=UPI003B9DFB4F|nr:hypothetical protein [Pseudomonas shirazica]